MTKKKIALIGAGQIGGTLALLFSQKNIYDVTLFDIYKGTAEGKALDISQMSSLFGADTKLKGSDDYKEISNSDVAIVTAGFPRKAGMSRDDLLQRNFEVIKQVALGLKTYSPKAFVIMVTNPLDIMVYSFYVLSQFRPEMIVGMAGVLDSARFRTFLAEELNISRRDIQTMVLGGHGDEMVPLIRFSSIAGIPLSEFVSAGRLKKERLDAIINRTREGGGEIVQLLGSGSAFYAPALSAMEMAESFLFDQKRVLPCASFLKGEYGVDKMFVGVPSIIGSGGVEKIIELPLNSDEKAMFDKSKKSVETLISEVKKMLE